MRKFSEVLADWFEAKNSLEYEDLNQEELDGTTEWLAELSAELDAFFDD